MTENARNVAVGLTVIVALVLLAGMIVMFSGGKFRLGDGYEITMHFPSSGDAKSGDEVHLAGIPVGRITNVSFTDGDPRKGVTITARIDADKRIPANVNAYIFSRGFMGGSYLQLHADGPERKDPATGQALEFLPMEPDRAIVIEGYVRTGLFPPELKEGLAELSRLAKNLNAIVAAPPAPATTTTQQAQLPPSLPGTLAKIDRTLDAMYAVLDAENRTNIKQALANLSEATAAATKAMQAVRKTATEAQETVRSLTTMASRTDHRIETLSAKLLESAEKVSTMLTDVKKTTARLEAGEGTLGKLINDPKLYDSLLEATQEMARLLEDFRRLVEQWNKRGVEIKLK